MRRRDREAYLDKMCRGDDDLRRKVDRLLSREQAVSAFLSTPPLAAAWHGLNDAGAGHALHPGGPDRRLHDRLAARSATRVDAVPKTLSTRTLTVSAIQSENGGVASDQW